MLRGRRSGVGCGEIGRSNQPNRIILKNSPMQVRWLKKIKNISTVTMMLGVIHLQYLNPLRSNCSSKFNVNKVMRACFWINNTNLWKLVCSCCNYYIYFLLFYLFLTAINPYFPHFFYKLISSNCSIDAKTLLMWIPITLTALTKSLTDPSANN